MWFKEYFPDDWARVQKYVADGRWRRLGVVDQRRGREHAVTRVAVPSCAVRPAVLPRGIQEGQPRHLSAGLLRVPVFAAVDRPGTPACNSFSTQKLTWGRPIPFPVGRWKGVDGSEILANLDPKSYTSRITGDTDITTDPAWTNEFTPLGDGKAVEFRYVGTGDTGGAPTEETVQNLEKAMTKAGRGGEGAQHVGRPACEGSHAGAVRRAAGIQRRADSQDARHRLLHLAGGDEEVQSPERAARRRGGAIGGGRAVADRPAVSGRSAARVVDARAVAPVPRRPDGHVHSAGVPVLVERRARLAQPVRRRAHLVHERGRQRAGHAGHRHPAGRFQSDLRVAARSRGGDGDVRRACACRGGGDRRVDRPRGAGAGARAVRQRQRACCSCRSCPRSGFKVFHVRARANVQTPSN